MNTRFFDILVPKEYEARTNGAPEKKVAWNKVGRAWASRSGESLSFELYLLPNQRYVVQLTENKKQEVTEEN